MKRVGLLALAMTIMYASFGVAGDPVVYGEGVTIEQPVAIPTLLEKPADFQGKTVRIDGVVTDVCRNRGCWIDFTDADSGKTIRVKVQDGVISFPASTLGHKASAQGVFEAIKLTPEQLAEMKQQPAEHPHSGCAKTRAADEQKGKEGCAKAAEKKEGCAKAHSGETESAEHKGGCGAKAQGDTIFLVRGTGALIST